MSQLGVHWALFLHADRSHLCICVCVFVLANRNRGCNYTDWLYRGEDIGYYTLLSREKDNQRRSVDQTACCSSLYFSLSLCAPPPPLHHFNLDIGMTLTCFSSCIHAA